MVARPERSRRLKSGGRKTPGRDRTPPDAGSLAVRSDRLPQEAEAETEDPGEKSANEDRVLIERARCGDHDAFETLVRKYQDRTVWIARNFVPDVEMARDIAQEAFLRVYKSLDRYDPAHRFYTWFYRIVVHLAIDALRRRKKITRWKLEATPLGQVDFLEPAGGDLEKEETHTRVHRILQRVPPKYRMLLVLRDLEGFTSKEISDVAGWNHATVRWRLHRARQLFKDAWEAAGYPAEV
ncbi:MAG: sigma-70 family RNA polymerase sigma factor [Planctomycetota bacterium]